ncbi:hypothetical protein [Pseudoalteromonas denitrificans]|uniref:Uncharacterized protein n=1 Tax=Pseudoalteromonas denitrificans DSM 6059 TaxID=1123010 RepID=A0A1I1QCU4_9GAMM|nr:hypothetical protein [Pseudoalteromonas denitrificans]SFD17043.1 hypothetical protein SAMN02745724_03738 [Pseudoalteromonas denitrificans DSM 6059]
MSVVTDDDINFGNEIGSYTLSERSISGSGHQLLVPEGGIVDETKYPELAAVIPTKTMFNSKAGQIIATALITEFVAMGVRENKDKFIVIDTNAGTGGSVYEVNFATETVSLIISVSQHAFAITEYAISPNGKYIGFCFLYYNSVPDETRLVWSSDFGATWKYQTILNEDRAKFFMKVNNLGQWFLASDAWPANTTKILRAHTLEGGAATWTAKSTITNNSYNSLLGDVADNMSLVVAYQTPDILHVSLDKASTWIDRSSNLSADIKALLISCKVLINDIGSHIIIIRTNSDSAFHFLEYYVSTDQAQSWTQYKLPLQNELGLARSWSVDLQADNSTIRLRSKTTDPDDSTKTNTEDLSLNYITHQIADVLITKGIKELFLTINKHWFYAGAGSDPDRIIGMLHTQRYPTSLALGNFKQIGDYRNSNLPLKLIADKA